MKPILCILAALAGQFSFAQTPGSIVMKAVPVRGGHYRIILTRFAKTPTPTTIEGKSKSVYQSSDDLVGSPEGYTREEILARVDHVIDKMEREVSAQRTDGGLWALSGLVSTYLSFSKGKRIKDLESNVAQLSQIISESLQVETPKVKPVRRVALKSASLVIGVGLVGYGAYRFFSYKKSASHTVASHAVSQILDGKVVSVSEGENAAVLEVLRMALEPEKY